MLAAEMSSPPTRATSDFLIIFPPNSKVLATWEREVRVTVLPASKEGTGAPMEDQTVMQY
jgi:hypothetical protein